LIRRVGIHHAALLGVTLPLGACLLDLPEPRVDDDAGFDGSVPDTGVTSDGMPPTDGVAMPDAPSDTGTGMDGGANPSAFFTQNGLDPHLIENDNTNLYFASGSTTIDSLSIANKTLSTLSSVAPEFITDLRVQGQNVYFTETVGSTYIAARCPTIGPCQNMRTTYSSSTTVAATQIDSNGASVFFSNDSSIGSGGGITKCSIQGSCAPFKNLDVPHLLRVSADSSSLVWDTRNGGGIYTCSIGSNCGSVTMGMNNSIQDITSDTSQYYFIETGGAVWRSKNNVATQIAPSTGNGRAIRSDGTSVYWLTTTTFYRCGVMSDCMSMGGEVIASNLQNASHLTITSNAVYYTTRQDHTIWRFLK
jgi:hypothetical protein